MRAVVVALLALSIGCATEPADQLLVRILDGTPDGLRIPDEIDAFEVRVGTVVGTGAGSDIVRFQQTFTLGATGVELPQTLAIVPAEDGTGVVRITVIGLRDAVPILTVEAIASFGSGLVEVPIALTRSCLGVVCPLGQSCADGVCEPVDPPPCEPTDPSRCVTGGLQRCDAGSLVVEPCSRCVEDGAGARCEVNVVPSNVGDRVALDAGSATVTVQDTYLFDTDDGRIVRIGTERTDVRAAGPGDVGGIVYQPLAGLGGGVSLGVFAMQRLDVPAGTSLVGTGSSALVLLVGGTVVIDGAVRAGASPMGSRAPGPGGGAGSCDAPGFVVGEGDGGGRYGQSFSPGGRDTGGAGASFGGRGGDGGGVSGEVVIARAADPYGTTELVPLLAGSGGGAGGDDDGGCGGDGGGALQITAGTRIDLRSGGVIDAGGAGGGGGRLGGDDTNSGAGGGGGSGGAVLLEAPSVVLAGAVGVFGGGGGQGAPGSAGADGGHGQIDGVVPVPATAGDATGGAGGAGSGEDGNAMSGAEATNAGGGGGGGGRIHIRTAAGREAFPSARPSAAVSVGAL